MNRSFFLPLVVGLLALAPGTARGQWRTQTFDLGLGWNAIYLHVDPSYTSVADFVEGTPITEIWLWAPAESAAQFITSPDEPSDDGSNWVEWKAEDLNPALETLIGAHAYLVKTESAYTDAFGGSQTLADGDVFEWGVIGQPVVSYYSWNSDGQNFFGLPLAENGGGVLLDNFFEFESVIQDNGDFWVYDTGSVTPTGALSAAGVTAQRDGAFWMRSDGDFIDYFGPFELSLQDLSGVHLEDTISQYRVRIRNKADEAITVTMTLADSETVPDDADLPEPLDPIIATPPVLVRDAIDLTTLTYASIDLNAQGSISWDLEPEGDVGSEVEVILGVNRATMTGDPGDLFAGILEFTDDLGYLRLDVPISARVASVNGLWVGEAEITQVRHDLTFFEREDDGTIIYDDDGDVQVFGTDTSFGSVPTSYKMRLIIHVDESGPMRLLQRVYYGPYSEDDSEIVLTTLESGLHPDRLADARRLSSSSFPWSVTNDSWEFTGDFGLSEIDLTGVDVVVETMDAEDDLPEHTPDYVNTAYMLFSTDNQLLVRVFDSSGAMAEDEVYTVELVTEPTTDLETLAKLVNDTGAGTVSDTGLRDDALTLADGILAPVESLIDLTDPDNPTTDYTVVFDLAKNVSSPIEDLPEFANTLFLGDYDGALYLRLFGADGSLLQDTYEFALEPLGTVFATLAGLVDAALEAGSIDADDEAALLTASEDVLSRAQIVTQVETLHDDHASNPFLHTFHPDHDNRNAEFDPAALATGIESYRIVRDIGLAFTLPADDFAALTAGTEVLTGDYAEEMTLIGQDYTYLDESENEVSATVTRSYGVQGAFALRRISPIESLIIE